MEEALKEGARLLDVKPELVTVEPDSETDFIVTLKKISGRVSIEIDPDGMYAKIRSIILPKSEAATITVKDVRRELANNKVIFGIDDDAIRGAVSAALSSEGLKEKIVVAKGRKPLAGRDSVFMFHFQTGLSIGKEIDEGGRIDFKNRGMMQNVTENDLIAESSLPTDGRAGMDIFGQAIPSSEGKLKTLKSVGGVEISEDNTKYYANITGAATFSGEDKIGVFHIYSIPEDVDYSTGNLVMDGALEIKGWIRSGFSARASGDIFVGEGIENSYVSAGANIDIEGGVLGKREKMVRAGGTIAAKFLESACVNADGDIYVRGPVTRSKVVTRGRLILTTPKGRLAGGSVSAAKSIEVNELGSKGAVNTVVEVGRNHMTGAQIIRQERALKFTLRNEQKIRMKASMILKKSKKTATNPSEKTLLAAHRKIKRQLAHQSNRLATLKNMFASTIFNKYNDPPSVIVRNYVYGGVTIILNGYRYHVDNDLTNGGKFILDTTDFKIKYIQ